MCEKNSKLDSVFNKLAQAKLAEFLQISGFEDSHRATQK